MSEIKPTVATSTDKNEATAEEKDWAAAKAHFESLKSTKPRPPKPRYAVTIGVSSRTLFDMVAERKIFQEEGLEKYVQHQQDHEMNNSDRLILFTKSVGLGPNPSSSRPIDSLNREPFGHVPSYWKKHEKPLKLTKDLPDRALMTVNERLRKLYPDSEELFDIVLMTNNHAQVGVRLINSINHYDLTIERFCMTGGQSPIGYLKAYMTNLYLSKDSKKVQEAIEEGIAAAIMFKPEMETQLSETQLRVAFDGDAVLFSDESEIIVKQHGLDMFFEHEKLNENTPLAKGPLKCFLEALGKLQKKFYAKNERLNCPIRTFLVTARSAASSGARVLKTLRSWGLEIDEALFLAGAPKGPLLQKIRPHIFFDDQMFHIEGAKDMGTISAHVPYGIGQKYNKGKLIEPEKQQK
ncbi:Cytosolic 5'-nucleotidase 1B [Anabarilius grahami]|uniref:Cytosolic 5'-nucleotidase 1B n=1 Tax=Anabarilius grahami TaxID=495550 RepID=A0A3N0ZA27_ANAGA|nr:Cytosolic 5'-nucleotidase 1B [Anabarilius grahami]